MNKIKQRIKDSDNSFRNVAPNKKTRLTAMQISKPARRRVNNHPSKDVRGDTHPASGGTSLLQTTSDASPAELFSPVARHFHLILMQPQSMTEGTRVALEALGISFYKRNHIPTTHTMSICAASLEPSEVARHAKALLRQALRLVVQASVSNVSKKLMHA
jgi:hypothetical protein